MNKLGLNKATIEDRLKRQGLTDEKLIAAISSVIVENNKEIEKNVSEVVSASFNKGFSKRGIR